MRDLPEHLSAWIADYADDCTLVTGVADDLLMQIHFSNGFGYRPGERDAEREHITAVIAFAPTMMQMLRRVLVDLKSGGPVDTAEIAALLGRLDAMDPSLRPEYKPMSLAERIELGKRNGELTD